MNHSTVTPTNRHDAPGSRQAQVALLSAGTVIGDDVRNLKDEDLGKIQDIMLDVNEGRIRYAVLSSGGFLGMGGRLFAIPWQALKLDGANKRFTLDIDADRLKEAPGFDKDKWPNMADPTYRSSIDSYYVR